MQGQISEIEKIKNGSEQICKTKDGEIEKLNKIISQMKQEHEEKMAEFESLNDENKKYLDMIIKYSLG